MSLESDNTPDPATRQAHAALIAAVSRWFIVLAGLLYATGFLIVMTFSDRLGLRDAAGEFFRVKYVHVGIMFFLFPTITVIPILAYIFGTRATSTSSAPSQDLQEAERIVALSSLVMALNMLLVFYLYILFAPPGFVGRTSHKVFFIFLTTTLGVIGVRWFTRTFVREELSSSFSKWTEWILCILIVAGLDTYSLYGMLGLLSEMFMARGWTFLAFMVLMAFLAFRIVRRVLALSDRRHKRAVWTIGLCVIGAVYYLSVLSFGFRVYPYVPAGRGGGDYTDTPDVVLRLHEEALPPELIESRSGVILRSKPMKLIEISDRAVFLADPNDAGGPRAWRALEDKKPKVFEVRRDEIVSIVHLN